MKMKVLRNKSNGEIASYVPIVDEELGRNGWYVAGVVCWNPELVCLIGKEEENGFEVVEMTEDELSAALEAMGVDCL